MPGALGFKKRYELNRWRLMGAGDIMLLHIDGLVEHSREQVRYYPEALEQCVRDVKDRAAREIFEAVMEELLAFADFTDDVSVVVVKLAV